MRPIRGIIIINRHKHPIKCGNLIWLSWGTEIIRNAG